MIQNFAKKKESSPKNLASVPPTAAAAATDLSLKTLFQSLQAKLCLFVLDEVEVKIVPPIVSPVRPFSIDLGSNATGLDDEIERTVGSFLVDGNYSNQIWMQFRNACQKKKNLKVLDNFCDATNETNTQGPGTREVIKGMITRAVVVAQWLECGFTN